jgi:hypothetical protein
MELIVYFCIKAFRMSKVWSFRFWIILLLISCKGTELSTVKGVIRGKISIGPLCPVETIPPRPECLPTAETYKNWQTAVWTLSRDKIAKVVPDSTGNYMITISTGNYIIDFDQPRTTTVGFSNLPHEIHVASGDTTVFDITIDTGIR